MICFKPLSHLINIVIFATFSFIHRIFAPKLLYEKDNFSSVSQKFPKQQQKKNIAIGVGFHIAVFELFDFEFNFFLKWIFENELSSQTQVQQSKN